MNKLLTFASNLYERNKVNIKFMGNASVLLPFLICAWLSYNGILVDGLSDIDAGSGKDDTFAADKKKDSNDDKSDVNIIIPIAVLGVIIHTMIGHTAEQNREKRPLLLFLSDSVVAICLGMIACSFVFVLKNIFQRA